MLHKLPYTLLITLLLLCSCQKETSNAPFPYPSSKAWAHGVNTLEEARQKSQVFEGLELDLYYSPDRDLLLVGHDPDDILDNLSFETWLEAIDQPSTHCYWLDIKNLQTQNAANIAQYVNRLADQHGLKNRIMIERWDVAALKIVKSYGLHVILWVDDLYISGQGEEEWRQTLQEDIDKLHPDALSADFLMFPLLPETFPDENIHLWDTPKAYNEENVAHTLMLMQHPSVKVVLVDYPEPVNP